MSNSVNIAFTVGDDGNIKLQNAKFREAHCTPLFVTTSDIEGPQYRYRLELRASSGDKWMDTGFAFLLPQEKDAKPEISFVTNHFSAEIVTEQTARSEPESDIKSLQKEIDALKRQVTALTAKLRVVADINLARSLRDLDRRGMV